MGSAAGRDADQLSHGSADSSSEVNGVEQNLLAHSHSLEDTTDTHCNTGTSSKLKYPTPFKDTVISI